MKEREREIRMEIVGGDERGGGKSTEGVQIKTMRGFPIFHINGLSNLNGLIKPYCSLDWRRMV